MSTTVYFVHYSSKPGGIEVLLPTIITGMKETVFKSFVIRPPNTGDENIYNALRTEVTYGSKSTLSALLKFFVFVRKNRNGIYQMYNTGPLFLLVLRILGVKRVIYSIHGTIYWKSNFQKVIRKALWKLAIQETMIITANSEYSGRVFTEQVNGKVKPVLLYNPIDTNRFFYKERYEQDQQLKIVYVGRLVNGKNLDKWFEAARYLLENDEAITFELYGTGPLKEEIEHWISSANLRDKIRVKGYVDEVEKVYQSADLLIFLSAYESFGNVVVESILCGTPVVTFAIPSMKEIFKNQPLFLIEDDVNYKEAILHKVKNVKDLKNAAKSVSEAFALRFGTAQHLERLTALYSSLA